jgi:hypothetical protein
MQQTFECKNKKANQKNANETKQKQMTTLNECCKQTYPSPHTVPQTDNAQSGVEQV